MRRRAPKFLVLMLFVLPPLIAFQVALLVLAEPGRAAIDILASKQGPIPVEATYNPHPDSRDVLLPMPCDLWMVFRLVAVPAEAGLPHAFVMGRETAEASVLYGRPRQGLVSGPFAPADLPPAWRALLPPDRLWGHSFYLMGKYEVSRYQWDAVMSGGLHGQCAPRSSGPDALPKGEVSWAEVQTFLDRYNAWLIARHPDKLPVFADNPRSIGFLLLPGEAEWEFAARGGLETPEAERGRDIFLPRGGGLADYGVFFAEAGAPVHEPEPIGSRLPNPLGLYDTVGNLKEMTEGRLREGGSGGGMLVKGGSYKSGADDVLPGRRDEVPRYSRSGAAAPKDLGFRVMIGAADVPSSRRLDALERAGFLPPGSPLPAPPAREEPRPGPPSPPPPPKPAPSPEDKPESLGELVRRATQETQEAVREAERSFRELMRELQRDWLGEQEK